MLTMFLAAIEVSAEIARPEGFSPVPGASKLLTRVWL